MEVFELTLHIEATSREALLTRQEIANLIADGRTLDFACEQDKDFT